MKRKKRKKGRAVDPDMPQGELRVIPDFLPPPHVMAKAPRIVTITIGLDAETIRFFKEQAEKRGGKYQRMIREVLARYAKHYDAA